MSPDTLLAKSAVDRLWACVASIRVALEAVRLTTAGTTPETAGPIELAVRQLERLADLADELEARAG